MIWIEIRGLPLCAWGSNAYKKVADMFGKFMFFEDEESTKMSSGRICISTKSQNFVSKRVLVEVHKVNYDVHVYELGTWNINIVDETLDSSDNIDVNGMEHLNSMSNMYVICRNVGFTELKIHHVRGLWIWIQFPSSSSAHNFESNAFLKSLYSCIKIATPSFKVDEHMIWIEIRDLPLCAWGSNAYKKVADMFGKFMFIEDEESTKMSSGRICISIKSRNFVSERVLVEVHGVNYDVHVYELGTWNINIVDETLDSSDNIDVNGMEKVEDSIDRNSLTDLNDLNDLKETINELASNEIQHLISKETNEREDDINNVSPKIGVSSDLSRPPGFEHMKRTSSKCSASFARYQKKRSFSYLRIIKNY
ncbi:RNA-directed DNA polymerase, eukaryota [Tanacetum coccineum]